MIGSEQATPSAGMVPPNLETLVHSRPWTKKVAAEMQIIRYTNAGRNTDALMMLSNR